VLVNDLQTTTADGTLETTTRTEEELSALKDLVAMAVGINEQRGDTLTIHSMSFKPIESDGVVVEQSPLAQFSQAHIMTLVQIAILSIVTLVLGLFVVKPLMKVDEPTEDAAAPTAALQELSEAAPDAIAPPTDPIDALKSLANDKTEETAGLIQNWLEETETAA